MSKEGKMEKSFLNFKAAHPEWIPSDPSGSLYLSRMVDLNTVGLGRRRLMRRPSSGMESTVHEADHNVDSSEKASQYDRALLASQNARRRLGQSRLGGPSSSSIFQSGVGLGMAQTAVLGDSHGSAGPLVQESTIQASTIPEEDLVEDGGVGSMLGESYVDGRRPKGTRSVSQSQQEEDEELEDGGVLGLLAQIYGTGVNLKGRGRGPPRAI
jgi:autophagy-related protein 9